MNQNERPILVSVFGGEPENRILCTKCNTLKFTGKNLIGHITTSCNCKVSK